eukprot:102930-Chlamydomonas_euryale.AAC.7
MAVHDHDKHGRECAWSSHGCPSLYAHGCCMAAWLSIGIVHWIHRQLPMGPSAAAWLSKGSWEAAWTTA